MEKSGTGEYTTVCTATLSSTRTQAQPSSQFAYCLLYSCTDSVPQYCRLITTRCSSAESPDQARPIVNADRRAKPSHYSYIGRAPNSYLRNINIPRAVQP